MANVRPIFLSGIHFGARPCKAERLLDLLREDEVEHFFLIGNIIDFWSMNRLPARPQSVNQAGPAPWPRRSSWIRLASLLVNRTLPD